MRNSKNSSRNEPVLGNLTGAYQDMKQSVWHMRMFAKLCFIAKLLRLFGCTEKKARKPSKDSCCLSKKSEEVTQPLDYAKVPWHKYDWEIKRDEWN